MTIYFIIAAMVLVAFLLGYTIGKSPVPNDGLIILDTNEEGHERITFQLGMEYDDLYERKRIVFDIVKK